MSEHVLSVREITASDIDLIIEYWVSATPTHLAGMGVDVKKLPSREQFTSYLLSQINLKIKDRQSYCIIWQVDGRPVGHSNTNPTTFGVEAYMHLHLWKSGTRQHGLGSTFVKMTIPYFFNHLKIKTLFCQPYALNPAPNKTMEKAGFEFIKEYVTVPGSFNFEQPVKLWRMSDERCREMSI